MSQSNQKMGFWGIFFFLLSGMIGLDILTPTASMGPPVFSWWIIVFLLFVIPCSLIVSELSTTYPGEGGIYDWTYQAFGAKWAARISWYYWINVPFWMPAIYMMVVGVFAEMFYPDMSTWAFVGISIACVWFNNWACSGSMKVMNVLTMVGGISKAGIVIAIIIAGFIYAANHGTVNEISLQTIQPTFDDALIFAPTLVYSLIGTEVVACISRKVKNPKRDLPLAIIACVLFVLIIYFGAVYSIMAAFPLEDLGLIAGLMQTYTVIMGAEGGSTVLVTLMGLITIVALITYLIPWTLAASSAAMEAAQAGEMPKVFARKNEHDAPVGANMQTAILATVALIVYGFMAGSADDLFWTLFAFGNALYFITYLFMLGAFIKLRYSQADATRPYKIPGGKLMAWFMALSAGFFIVIGLILFNLPEIFDGNIDWEYSGPVLGSTLLAFIFVEYQIKRNRSITAELASEPE